MNAICAIDFGTSNSAIALPDAAAEVRLVELEPGFATMPTAVFYAVEGLAAHEQPRRLFGRAAIAAYVEGVDGRLMRSMKSILGSTLAGQSTEVGPGHSVRYLDVVAGFLHHLKARAERAAGTELRRAVLGRPVYFVDDDPQRDAAAQAALESAARLVGFEELAFQYEPIAAALAYEDGVDAEQLVLVADIGGGTSDFSLVRVGPKRRGRKDRADDILANHGVHVAGTDFDRRVELAAILPAFGFGAHGPGGREVPSKVYHDLATWHLVNTVYAPRRVAELRGMRSWYDDARQHARLMRLIDRRLGHALVARAEDAKIALGQREAADAVAIGLADIEDGLQTRLGLAQAAQALQGDFERIVAAADETLALSGIARERVQALFFTGGSTGLSALTDRLAARYAAARVAHGDRFASVAQGLGRHARVVYG